MIQIDRNHVTKNELADLLRREDFRDVYELADRIRAENVGDVVHIRAILEFSNHCRRVCRYCGLNARNSALPRYRMKPEEMIGRKVVVVTNLAAAKLRGVLSQGMILAGMSEDQLEVITISHLPVGTIVR